MQKNGLCVGVFDSGIGGLTVLGECVRLLPEATFCYYGDNENAPYGSKSPEEILALTKRAMDFFWKKGVNAVVIACNTATAVCIDELRRAYPFPIVGVEPALRTAAKYCKRVAVLSTPRTAQSERIKRLVCELPACEFTLCALPNLAISIERKLLYGKEFSLAEQLPKGDFDGVVLGCTHYSFLRGEITTFYNLPVFDGNFGTAKRLASLLHSKKTADLGIFDHTQPRLFPEHMYGKSSNKSKIEVEFVGNSAKLNQKIFNSNICFSFK